MQAEYDLTPEDYVAFTVCHHAQSPAARKQWRNGVTIGFLVMLMLPGFVLLGNDKPFAETARAIWPLLMGPVFFLLTMFALRRFRFRGAKQLLSEARKAPERRTLSLEVDGLTVALSSGSNHRTWSAVERILQTADHAFVYTSGIEAIIIPRGSFSSAVSYDEFLNEIARRANVEIKRVSR